MVSSVSTLGLQLMNIGNLSAGQSYLANLNQQLASGKVSNNLDDYGTSDAQNMMNFNDSITQQQGFLSVINTITPRLQTYDSSLSGIENVASQASTLADNNSIYNSSQNQSNATQIQGFMQQVQYYLNQNVNGRYIFAGSRYQTAPVGDITALPAPTAADVAAINTNVSTNALPDYDSQYVATASASVGNGSMTLAAKNSGTFGNNVSVSLSAGTASGTKATISVPGQADEVYDNIGGSGTTFWQNLSNAINTGGGAASVAVPGDIAFTSQSTGAAGNKISVALSAGTVSGTKATISVPGQPDEVYDNIGGYGAAFWQNLTDAVNTTGGAASVAIPGDMAFLATSAGAAGNDISVALTPNQDGTTSATITNGTTTENYPSIAGSGAAFWSNLQTAINSAPSALVTAVALGGADAPTATTYDLAGGTSPSARVTATALGGADAPTNGSYALTGGTPPSCLVTATAGTTGATPTLGTPTTLSGGTGSSMNYVASAAISNDITFSSLSAGIAGNNLKVSFSAGTGSTTTATVTNGATTETYPNIAGSGAAFWTNLANAINSAPSSLVMATTGGGTDAPSRNAIYPLSGGSNTDAAYDEDQVTVDTTQTLKYGVSSNQVGFQQLILGLRFAYAATQDQTNYSSDMSQASSLITQGLANIRGVHTGVADANTTITQIQTTENTNISNLQDQIGTIQNADVNTVAVKINSFQSTLQASYAATAQMTQLSILKYLQ